MLTPPDTCLMWRVDDCFTHCYVFYYWMCRLDKSVICFRIVSFFPAVVLALLFLWIFYLSLPEGDKFF